MDYCLEVCWVGQPHHSGTVSCSLKPTGCTQTLSYCSVIRLVLGQFGPLLRSLQVCISSIWLLFQPALSILFKPLVAVKTGQSQRPQAAHTRPPRPCSCLGPDHLWARGMRSYSIRHHPLAGGMRSYSAIQPCSPSPLPRHPAGNQGSCLLYFLRKSGQSGRLLFLNSCWYPVSFQFLENQPPSITGSIIFPL